MRIMAIDYGDAHTGIAISDPTGFLAGYTTVIDDSKRFLGDGVEACPLFSDPLLGFINNSCIYTGIRGNRLRNPRGDQEILTLCFGKMKAMLCKQGLHHMNITNIDHKKSAFLLLS